MVLCAELLNNETLLSSIIFGDFLGSALSEIVVSSCVELYCKLLNCMPVGVSDDAMALSLNEILGEVSSIWACQLELRQLEERCSLQIKYEVWRSWS